MLTMADLAVAISFYSLFKPLASGVETSFAKCFFS